MQWKNKVNKFFDSLFFTQRDKNKNLDGHVYVETTEGDVVLGNIATRKKITDKTIIFTFLVDNQIISEAKFDRCPNDRAGQLICQSKYKVKSVEPVLIVERAESIE